MKFTKSDFKTLVMVIIGVIVAGLILNYGEDLPVLEQAGEGFGN